MRHGITPYLLWSTFFGRDPAVSSVTRPGDTDLASTPGPPALCDLLCSGDLSSPFAEVFRDEDLVTFLVFSCEIFSLLDLASDVLESF